MNIEHRNSTPRRSSLAALLVAGALVFVASPAVAADGPSNAEAKPQSRAPKPKPKAAEKPKASSRTLDATARRALRASSQRAEPAPRGERVATRTVAPATADEGGRKSKKKAGKTADDARAPSDASDRKISLDEDFLVEGKLEKPNAFYILRRSQSGYDWARLDAKFLPLVLESVQDPLF